MNSRTRTDRPLPNFLVIGAMKAGTTSLFHYLREHPQVFMSPIKELDFFVEGANWKRGMEWYRRQFEDASPDAVAIGEASTAYTKHPLVPGVPERIAQKLPKARLIYVVRDPIERIRSHYEHRVAIGAEKAPFKEAVSANPVYLLSSLYASQVEQYLEYSPLDRLLLIESEDLRRHRSSTMRRVYSFLGVNRDFLPPGLEREYYRTSERVTHVQTSWSIRRTLKRYVPASKRAKELVDEVLPRTFDRILARTGAAGDSRTALEDEVREDLAGRLREDVGRLRAYMPDGFDGWGIA